jgi:hypothetical protein
MVNTGLDAKYTANAGGQINYDPVPDGEYTLRVKEVDPWKKTTRTIQVIQRDEKGNALKDDKGKNITETVNNCEFYNCNVRFEIVGGEYDGRLIFHNLTTHPNMSWSIPNFLYALGLKELAASQIQTECIGKECIGNVYTDTYEKKQQNKDTGIDETVERKINRIKSFKPLETPNTDSEETIINNLGI